MFSNKLLTVHYDNVDYVLVHNMWKYKGETYETFELSFVDGMKFVQSWGHFPKYTEMTQSIENFLEVGD